MNEYLEIPGMSIAGFIFIFAFSFVFGFVYLKKLIEKIQRYLKGGERLPKWK